VKNRYQNLPFKFNLQRYNAARCTPNSQGALNGTCLRADRQEGPSGGAVQVEFIEFI
jgi:hypothetical protein